MRSPHILAAWLAAGAVARPCMAQSQAQTPTSRADRDAEALLARAQQALDTNDTAEQLASLRGLNYVAPEPRITCALGMVERRLGEWPEAAEHLTQCVANPPKEKGPEWLTNIRGEKAMARAEVGIVTITAPPCSHVSVDGEGLGAAAGRELFLVPKREHRIDVRCGPSIQRYTMTLGRGTTRSLTVTFPPPPPLGDWLVFGGAIASGALAAGGGVLYAVSSALHSEAEFHRTEALKTPKACYISSRSPYHCSEYESLFNRAGAFRDAALAAWIAAGGIVITTTIYHFAKPATGTPRVTVGLASVGLEGVW